MQLDAPLADGGSDGRVVRTRMRDVACFVKLPPLLVRIREAGRTVDVEVRGPSLQAVFIHLTGRELRE